MNENIWISIKISLKFVPKCLINNIPALVQIMAWRGPGDKPLSEPLMVRLPTHICVTWPQWVNSLVPGRCSCNLVLVIVRFILRLDILTICYEITLGWIPKDLTDYLSKLVQVMVWHHQATSHYLSQCWPGTMLTYRIIKPQTIIISKYSQPHSLLAKAMYIFC